MAEETPDFGAGVHVFVGPGMATAFDFVEPDFGGLSAFHRRFSGFELIEGDLIAAFPTRKLGDIFLGATVDSDDSADSGGNGNIRSPATFVQRISEPF